MIPILIIMTVSLTELSQQTAKKCHRSCVFAAACTVSLSSFQGFAIREVISVRFGILSQILELHIEGTLRAVTPRGPVLLVGYITGCTGGVGVWCANEETPC